MNKHSSLLQKFVNYDRKTFYNYYSWAQCYKKFYGRNLLIFILIKSVCYHMLKNLVRDKHSSLFRKFVNYGRKIFYNYYSWGQCYKTFSVRDLRIFVISQSVCQTIPEKLTNDKHSSLLRKSVNYGHKKFYNIEPWPEVNDTEKQVNP